MKGRAHLEFVDPVGPLDGVAHIAQEGANVRDLSRAVPVTTRP